jgi:voltage-gated potassium channel
MTRKDPEREPTGCEEEVTPVTAPAPVLRQHSNAYNIFILVLTIFSLAVMVLLVLPGIDDQTRSLLLVYDNVACVIFLIDFAYNISGSRPRSGYFIHQRGWLDLLGSIPSFGIFQFTALLRLFRLSRLARMRKLMGGQRRDELVKDVLDNRGQYAAFITILAAGIVLSVASIMVLQFEGKSPDANITTGGDALWWGVVTITTVGYGDKYPVTTLGRLTGVSVMFAGVGIIGALASILASILVPPPKPLDEPETEPDQGSETPEPGATSAAPVPAVLADGPASDAILSQLAVLQAEVRALREALPREPQ